MSSAVPVRAGSRRCRSGPSTPSLLRHWSEDSVPTRHDRPPISVVNVLHDLTSWAADLAIVLTRECPEDRIAIERVRRYAHACLAGEACPDLAIDDVLTTAATLMSGIDRNIRGPGSPDDHERDAIGAPVAA